MHALMLRFHGALPAFVRQRVSAAHISVATAFVRFGTVGLAALGVDAVVVYSLRAAVGLYVAGLLSFGIAVTTTWWLNRIWTFRGHGSGPLLRQWARFVAANTFGFLLNRGTYFTLVTVSSLCARQPILAIAAGAVAGMFVNFHLSRRVVFK